jgi:hypothetical protein
MRPELIDEGGVRVEVGPITIDGVVNLSEPRLLEDRIGHKHNLDHHPASARVVRRNDPGDRHGAVPRLGACADVDAG